MKLCRNFIFAIVLLALLMTVQSARADIAPPPAPGFGGIKVFQPTEVEMIYERVEVDIQTLPMEGDFTPYEADINAWFVMRNTGKVDENMQVGFPLSNMRHCDESGDTPLSKVEFFTLEDSFYVEVNGQAVVTQRKAIDCSNYNDVLWGTFDVNFPVGKDILIKVNYKMQAYTSEFDNKLVLEYVLATGSGWKGPIKQAYVVFRFPYMVSNGNINTAETTIGFQKLYNEIFWSFRDLEPTPKDNIVASFFEPTTWLEIQNLESWVNKNSTDAEAWLKLLEIYRYKAPFDLNSESIEKKYQQAIAANPNTAELYGQYANFLLPNCCLFIDYETRKYPVGGKQIAEKNIFPLISKSLALDPNNKMAQASLMSIREAFPDITFTPPPTIPPTATSAVSSTPTITPSPSITPKPSQTPVVVTVVNTKIVTATPQTTAIPTQTPTITPSPSPTFTPTPETWLATTSKSGSAWIIWPLLLLLGFAAGIFISKKKWI